MKRLVGIALLACTGCGAGASSGEAVEPVVTPSSTEAPTLAPVQGAVATATQAKEADGQEITLVGTYAKRMSLKGMPRPGRPSEKVFLGYVQILLEGEGDTARIQLGTEPRPEQEIEAFADKRVRVRGRMVVQPTGDSMHASTKPRPTLMDPGQPKLAE